MVEQLLFMLSLFISGYLLIVAAYIFESLPIFDFLDIRIKFLSFVLFTLWSATVIFFILALLGAFRLKVILIISILSAGCARIVFKLSIREFINKAKKNYSKALVFVSGSLSGINKYFFPVFLVLFLIISFRTLIVPPLGWNTLTYHGPKAVVWAQSGALINLLNAPGGPSYYSNLFGGGEILTAWSMIIFKSDFAAGAMDAVMWLLLGISVFCLATVFGISRNKALINSIAILFIPTVWLAVGSAYVELTLWVLFTIGIFFFKGYIEKQNPSFMVFSMASFGLAANVKITLLPVLLFALFSFFILIIFRRERVIIRLIIWGTASVLALVLLVPWLLVSYKNTGYFIFIPFEIFGWKLGDWHSALQWYKERNLGSTGIGSELAALKKIFGDPRAVYTHISVLSFGLIILGLYHTIKKILLKNYEKIFYLLFSVLIFAVFYSKDFMTVRLHWAKASGRFIIPAVLLLSVFAFKEAGGFKKYEEFFLFLVLLTSFVQIVNGVFSGWQRFEITILLTAALVIILFLLINLYLRKILNRAPALKILGAMYIVIFIILSGTIFEVRSAFRNKIIQGSVVFDKVPRYWSKAAEIADSKYKSYRIAVTAGPAQSLDNWFIYFFYGRRFQNKLLYISPAKHEEIITYRTNEELEKNADFDLWYGRLKNEKVDLVLCLLPESLEYRWCNENLGFFARLEPSSAGSGWGLFSLKK